MTLTVRAGDFVLIFCGLWVQENVAVQKLEEREMVQRQKMVFYVDHPFGDVVVGRIAEQAHDWSRMTG